MSHPCCPPRGAGISIESPPASLQRWFLGAGCSGGRQHCPHTPCRIRDAARSSAASLGTNSRASQLNPLSGQGCAAFLHTPLPETECEGSPLPFLACPRDSHPDPAHLRSAGAGAWDPPAVGAAAPCAPARVGRARLLPPPPACPAGGCSAVQGAPIQLCSTLHEALWEGRGVRWGASPPSWILC